MGNWLKKEDELESPHAPAAAREESPPREELSEKVPCHETVPPPRPSHNVIPSLPRPITFKRQDSERRERLYPHEPDAEERRATSADRRLGTSCEKKISPLCLPELATSIPKPITLDATNDRDIAHHTHHDFASTACTHDHEHSDRQEQEPDTSSHYDWHHHDLLHHSEQLSDALDDLQLHNELEAKWILNLSMHFRDHSDREKFFITYAEEPNHWRRITVSCDYRYALDDSLEADLKSLHYQRDKSARIYEAIRDSLPSIQFYPTVTNLKLETSEGRLHVHVTEDVNEIVEYPHVSCVAHLDLPHYPEDTIEFEGHMSGFVYKVRHSHGRNSSVMIKKEIPGPEAIDEFLYEINALASLRDARNVVDILGLVLDPHDNIKGILLSYCPHGALVDLLYDFKHVPTALPWSRIAHWSHNLLSGLSAIHEAGFVQGDFTLSNIVIDADDTAQIIDINRRGCPIGWEPPEMSGIIRSGGRVGMYIGVKSDLWQAGMVLWGLAERCEEPERVERPLVKRWSSKAREEVPLWFRDIVEICLSEDPRDRLSAKELLGRFPLLSPREEVVVKAPDGAAFEEPKILAPEARPTNALLNGTLQQEFEIRQPSPLANAGGASIETDVEYLVPASESSIAAVSMPEVVPQPASGAQQPLEHITCPIQEMSSTDGIQEVPDVAPVAESGAEMPKEEPSITDVPEAAHEPHDDRTTTNEVHNKAESPATNATSQAQDHAAALSLPLELGNPPLATFSPPVATPITALRTEAPASELRPISEDPQPVDLSSKADSLPLAEQSAPQNRPAPTNSEDDETPKAAVELGNPLLAMFSPPPPPETAPMPAPAVADKAHVVPASVGDLELGNPPLATLSPPPPLGMGTTSQAGENISHAAATLKPMATNASPSPDTTTSIDDSGLEEANPSTGEEPSDSREASSFPASTPSQTTIPQALSSERLPATHAAESSFLPATTSPPGSVHQPRTNTLGFSSLPVHQDSGFDERASVSSASSHTEEPVSLLSEALHAQSQAQAGASTTEHTDQTEIKQEPPA